MYVMYTVECIYFNAMYICICKAYNVWIYIYTDINICTVLLCKGKRDSNTKILNADKILERKCIQYKHAFPHSLD